MSASRLATVPRQCPGPSATCSCPWEVVGECADKCVAEGVEIVIERVRATAQLCAPGADAGPVVAPVTGLPERCDEGNAYRCAGGDVVECPSGRPIGHCLRGCYDEGVAIDEDGIDREAAFAILCSR